MEIINSISNFSSEEATYVTIGTFDGIHIGHQKILSDLITSAKQDKRKSVSEEIIRHMEDVLDTDLGVIFEAET